MVIFNLVSCNQSNMKVKRHWSLASRALESSVQSSGHATPQVLCMMQQFVCDVLTFWHVVAIFCVAAFHHQAIAAYSAIDATARWKTSPIYYLEFIVCICGNCLKKNVNSAFDVTCSWIRMNSYIYRTKRTIEWCLLCIGVDSSAIFAGIATQSVRLTCQKRHQQHCNTISPLPIRFKLDDMFMVLV